MSGIQKYLDQLTPGKNAGAVAITVRMALLDRNVHFYGRLAALPLVTSTIAAPSASDDQKTLFAVLRLLTYGVWRDLDKEPEAVRKFVKSTPEIASKLRQLSLLSVAETSKSIPYHVLVQELEIDSTNADAARELEDVVIDSTTAGLLTVTLHPQKRIVQVHDAAARDVDLSEVPKLLERFEEWGARCRHVIGQLQAAKGEVAAFDRSNVEREMAMSVTEDIELRKALRRIVEDGKVSGGRGGGQ